MKENKLDLRDKKILSELDFNARIPISKLAKKLRLSRQVTAYRIENLEKKGYILGYTAIVNSAKLGYRYCRMGFKLQNLNKEFKEKILEFCRDPKIAFLGIIDGYWDLFIGYWVKDLIEFENFINDFICKFGHIILDKDICIGLHVWQFQHRYLLNKTDDGEFETGGEIENIAIDDINKRLLVLLVKNAKIPLIELSQKLNLTPKAVIYRIKNLIMKKILLGYRTQINYKALGYHNNKVFLYLQNLTKEKEKNLFFYLKANKNCIYITKSIGKPDLEFEILVKNREKFFSFIQELKEKFGEIIKNHDQFIIHEEPISRFIPLK